MLLCAPSRDVLPARPLPKRLLVGVRAAERRRRRRPGSCRAARALVRRRRRHLPPRYQRTRSQQRERLFDRQSRLRKEMENKRNSPPLSSPRPRPSPSLSLSLSLFPALFPSLPPSLSFSFSSISTLSQQGFRSILVPESPLFFRTRYRCPCALFVPTRSPLPQLLSPAFSPSALRTQSALRVRDRSPLQHLKIRKSVFSVPRE